MRRGLGVGLCAFVGLMLGAVSPAHAQVVNPTTVIFDHSDFAGTDSYSIGYFSSVSATVPVQEAPFPKPTNARPALDRFRLGP